MKHNKKPMKQTLACVQYRLETIFNERYEVTVKFPNGFGGAIILNFVLPHSLQGPRSRLTVLL